MHFAVVTQRLTHGDDITYLASIPELDIDAYGATPEAAFARLQEISKIELAHRREHGVADPTPQLFSSIISVGIATDFTEILPMVPAAELQSTVSMPSFVGKRIAFA